MNSNLKTTLTNLTSKIKENVAVKANANTFSQPQTIEQTSNDETKKVVIDSEKITYGTYDSEEEEYITSEIEFNEIAKQSDITSSISGKQAKYTIVSVSCATSDFTASGDYYVCNKSVSGLLLDTNTNQVAEVSPTPATLRYAAEAQIVASCTTAGTLTLTATAVPSDAITFNVVMWNK